MTSCLGFMGGMETTNHNPNLNHRTNPNPMINNTNTNTTITTTNRRYRGGGSYREGGGMEQGLKCPRCESANTKFCYFNNYSRKQPRHFCKNCRRYWTKGGALRNVPVGGGCRKNNAKHPQNHRPRIAGVADPTASTMSAAAAHMESIMNHHPTTHENNSLYTSHMGLLYPNVKREEAQASISMPMYNTNPNTNNNNNNNNNNEILIFPHPAAPMVPSSSLDEQYMMSKPLLLPQHQLHYLPQFQTPGEPFHDHDALELSLRRVASSSSSCKTIMKSPTSLGEQFGVVVDDPNLWMLGGPIPGWPMDFHATTAQ